MPVAFWYMSAGGVILLFIYAYDRASPGGTFGLCFNIVVYVRNLVHIWRTEGRLTPARNLGIHALAGTMSIVAITLTLVTWHKTDKSTSDFLIWTGIWAVGQTLFFLRFLVQWLATEFKRKSVVPPSFWYFSLIAALLQGVYFFQREDWFLAIGMAATLIVYARNIWFIYLGPEGADTRAGALD
jgi:lipid-A-disaccharide synthase-like uncharacterized protein